MNWYVERRASLGIALACVLFSAISLGTLWIIDILFEEARRVEHTHAIVTTARALDASIRQAESARRGAALTGSASYTTDFAAALERGRQHSAKLSELTEDNQQQHDRAKVLVTLTAQRLDQLQSAMESTLDNTLDDEDHARLTEEGRLQSEAFHDALTEFEEAELALLDERKQRRDATEEYTLMGLIAAIAVALLAISVTLLQLNRQAATRRDAQEELRQANMELQKWLDDLKVRNEQVLALNELGNILQACRNRSETFDALQTFLAKAFPDSSGAIGITRSSRNLVTLESRWGSHPPSGHEFDPQACWALRMGHAHVTEVQGGMVCSHLDKPIDAATTCVPLNALGETLGVIMFTNLSIETMDPGRRGLVEGLSRNVAMAVSNLILREQLVNQSITDPLTGLFNRRYMEESLKRELNRAQRTNHSVGVILLDVDHFKKFNDTYGHQAGDEILRAMGMFLKSSIRASDIACRYGGEEFALVLPDSDLESTLGKAEELRAQAHYLEVHHTGSALPAIGVSVGVSMFPDNGTTGEHLIAHADRALYLAKAQGRDRVCVATTAGHADRVSDQV